MLERGLTLCQATHISLMFPLVASQLGYAYALTGRISQALPLLEQAMEQTAAAMGSEAAMQAACLSEAYLLAGRLQDASTLAGRALEFSRAHRERGHQAYALCLLGEIAAQCDPPARGGRSPLPPGPRPHRGTRHAPAPGPLPPRPWHTVCKLYQREQARAELDTAIELYRAMDMTFWFPQAEATLAQAEGR